MKTDFHIDVIPVSISLECPHCDSDIVLNWKDIYVPGYWGGETGELWNVRHVEKILSWAITNMIRV